MAKTFPARLTSCFLSAALCAACAHGSAHEPPAPNPARPAFRSSGASLRSQAATPRSQARALVSLALAEPEEPALSPDAVERARRGALDALARMPEVALGPEALAALQEEASARALWALTLRGALRPVAGEPAGARVEARLAVIDAQRHNLIATLSGVGVAEGRSGDPATLERASEAALGAALRGMPRLVAALPALAEQGVLAQR